MSIPTIKPTGRERFFDEDEIIVSKTDTKGIITYANKVFLTVAGYTEEEVLGQPHNCIRHPDMPRSVFQLLWDTVMAGDEIFAYVVNQTKSGDHYWVLAHVTPTFNDAGDIIGYHSNRRVPDRTAVDKVIPVYKALCEVEAGHTKRKDGIAAAMKALGDTLGETPYDEFVWSL